VRAVAQRVRSARVTVDGALVSEMDAGLLALVGVAREDDEAAARELARRLVHLRVFADEEGRMNRSLLDTGGTLGVVGNFSVPNLRPLRTELERIAGRLEMFEADGDRSSELTALKRLNASRGF